MNSNQTIGIYKGPKTLSIMPTYGCPAECKNCGTLSSPRDKTSVDLDYILKGIKEAKELGFFNVVFTGGEPTLKWHNLLKGIEYATSINFPTRVVTNAYWATSHKHAVNKLQKLKDSGLNEINYSTGDEHAQFVPFERVVTATIAALEVGFDPHIMIEVKDGRMITKDIFLSDPAILALSKENRARVNVIESPWMPMDPFEVENYDEGTLVNEKNILRTKGCDSVLQTYVLQANGNIGSCCGLGMRIIPELNTADVNEEGFLEKAIERSENDVLKLWLHYSGPERILQWVAEKDPSIDWENMYAHKCQACLRIYKDPMINKILREHYHEIVGDLMFTAWLEEELLPEKLGDVIQTSRRYGD